MTSRWIDLDRRAFWQRPACCAPLRDFRNVFVWHILRNGDQEIGCLPRQDIQAGFVERCNFSAYRSGNCVDQAPYEFSSPGVRRLDRIALGLLLAFIPGRSSSSGGGLQLDREFPRPHDENSCHTRWPECQWNATSAS